MEHVHTWAGQVQHIPYVEVLEFLGVEIVYLSAYIQDILDPVTFV